MNDIFTFASIALLLVISPGPNIALILRTVSSRGRSAGIQNILGFIIGAFCHGAFSIFGLSAVILQSPQLFWAIKIAGAMYIAYLGLKAVYQSFGHRGPREDVAKVEPEGKSRGLMNMGDGFFTQVLNPKGSMFYLAVFPQFINFQSTVYLKAFALVGIHALLMFAWFGGVCVFVSSLKNMRNDSPAGRWIERVSGGALVVFSLILLTQDAKP